LGHFGDRSCPPPSPQSAYQIEPAKEQPPLRALRILRRTVFSARPPAGWPGLESSQAPAGTSRGLRRLQPRPPRFARIPLRVGLVRTRYEPVRLMPRNEAFHLISFRFVAFISRDTFQQAAPCNAMKRSTGAKGRPRGARPGGASW
jgi:hypothetical protein